MTSFLYASNYDSTFLRGADVTERPWNLSDEIISNSKKGSTLLDLGCGTAFKLLRLEGHFSEIIGLEISDDMIFSAKTLIEDSGCKNIKICKGDNYHLPFDSHSFDTITCMLSNWDASEIARVLKPDGNIIIEHIGCEDKIDFKKTFGMDVKGWRGQFLDFNARDFLQSFHDKLNPYFGSVRIKNGFWDTCYTEQGVLELLLYTPMIRNYDKTADQLHVEKACENFKCQQGIKLTQNRVLIHAKNP